jgi:hypothetical protein
MVLPAENLHNRWFTVLLSLQHKVRASKYEILLAKCRPILGHEFKEGGELIRLNSKRGENGFGRRLYRLRRRK